MIRVLIVDDSATIRTILQALLTAAPGIEVAGQAENGQEAVHMTHRLAPDVITMDVEMPVMDGLAATRQIMAEVPTPIIIVTAQTNYKELSVAFEAMEAGALDVLAKPEGFGARSLEWEMEFLDKVKRLSAVRPWENKKRGYTGAGRW